MGVGYKHIRSAKHLNEKRVTMNISSKVKYEKHLNEKYGRLLLIKLVYDTTKSGRYRYNYKCQCDCGNIKNIPCLYILERNQRSCGCLKCETTVNYSENVGKRFGNIVILELVREKRNNDKQNKLYYKYQCDCGNTGYFQVHSFHNDNYTSCGCLQVSNAKDKYSNMVGQQFNDLTILEYIYDPESSSHFKHQFRCKCKCGNDNYIINCSKLLRKNVVNCTSCYTNKSRNSYSDLLDYCEANNLKLISDFTAKSSPIIKENGKVSTIYNKYLFECLECGCKFEKTLSPSSTLLCPTCNNTKCSVSEQLLHNFFQENEIFYSKQLIKSVDNMQQYVEVDFLINNVGVELHGLEPHCTTCYEYDNYFISNKPKNYHLNKLESCKKQNIDLLQFWNIELIQKPDIVKSIILNRLNKTKYIEYARNCRVQKINKKDYNKFMTENHIQGTTNGELVRLGLYYKFNDNLVSVMSFGKSRYSNHQWELFRFANCNYSIVIGAASKLFKYFINNYNPDNIITYSDRRIFDNGNLYNILGFKFSHISPPNYWYFNHYGYDKTRTLYHRSQFMKHLLKDKLKKYDENLTEWENMELNNYLRIYDCGNKIYVWKQ
jgi:hypothetical protein